MPGASISRVNEPSTTAFSGNIPYRGLEYRSPRKPEYLIYVYNVSARTFKDVGRIRLTVPGVVEDDPTVLAEGAGKENEKYHYVTSFPQPVLIPSMNDMSGEIELKETDGRRFVVDMISPDNLTLTLDTVIRPDQAFSIGNDYSQKGIFFSYSNPPSKIDVRKAIDRMENYYKGLLETAATLELTDKAALSQQLASNPDYSYAATYFGKDVTWNRKQTRPSLCPNCGEARPVNAKFHMATDGGLCVEPSVEAWQQVVRVGRRKLEDVPEEFRWKKAPAVDTK